MNKPAPDKPAPDKPAPDKDLQGEGNYDATRRYDKAARDFVQSGKVGLLVADVDCGEGRCRESCSDAVVSGSQTRAGQALRAPEILPRDAEGRVN